MISKRDRMVLATFSDRVRKYFPGARMWAFGSRARGDATWDSDFDVCIVLEQFDTAADHILSDIAWEVGFDQDRVITVVPFSREQFEEGPPSQSSLVRNILREGVGA